MAHLTENPADKERFICIYPGYINSKKTLAEGRRIPAKKAVENPSCAEIRDVLMAAGMNIYVENKLHPREWNRDAQFKGRVRVQIKQEDGSPCQENLASRKEVMYYVCEMIPKLKTRTQKSGGADTSSHQGDGGKKSKKKKKLEVSPSAVMRFKRSVDVPVYDLSLIRSMWEGRAKVYRQRQNREQERVEKSALAKINQHWQYRIQCKKALKDGEVARLQQYLERSTLTDIQPYQEPADSQVEEDKYRFELDGEAWMELPVELRTMLYLREWHIRGTKIQRLPDYIVQFQDLSVLDIPKNSIEALPVEIGKLFKLRELNVNYNRLSSVPPELGDCENLEWLELTGNQHLSELPFELSNLKKLKHLDIAENRFASIPICALRMNSLQLLDISNNVLTDLPEDMDRLEELETLFVHKNRMSYLPHCLTNISSLKMIVVSGDELTCIPTKLCETSTLKFIRLYDSPVGNVKNDGE
ncbi:leucine-rich repeat-containing protein 2, partial [Aplochiton taeniatus]